MVKAVEKAAVPRKVIFSAAAERERAVSALSEIRDSWDGWYRKHQSVIGVKVFGEFSGH